MTHDVTGIIQRRQEVLVESLKDCSPVMLFEKIFDDNVMSLIVENSMKYAGQHNRHSFEIDKPELRTFLAVLCFTGYHELPSERAYWSLDENLGVPLIANCMSRNRFSDIKRNLHFVDNSLAEGSNDKMFKMRPLCDFIHKKLLPVGSISRKLIYR
ncbi:unnamed protein product [Parnassius apollo]|uniref:(apollo) hypothetical protein n=1 Tax=Parnassius apollo TaxID=110799 RepID=A0A8S3WRJ8_PARAO|nr:unnamed protein product [Parnassius apollo]